MWRIVKYTIQIIGYSPVAASFLILGVTALAALHETNAGRFLNEFEFVKYQAFASVFLAPLLIASAFKPEDISAVEVHNTVPYPFWRIITKHVILRWLAITLTEALITLVVATGNVHHPVLLLLNVVNVASNSLLFGGLALWATVLGRDSKKGQLLGLSVFVLSLLARTPEFINRAVHPYNVREGLDFPALWWTSRLGYIVLGVLVCVHTLYLARDTDRLIVGKRPRSTQLVPVHKFGVWGKWKGLISPSEGLWTPPSKFLGLVTYEALLTIKDGVIPIVVLVMCVVSGWVLSLLSAIHHAGFEDLLISQANSPQFLIYFLFPFLPIFLVNRIPHDRQNSLDQLLLTTISPREYLIGKAVGACVATLGTFLLGNIPLFLFLTLAALFRPPVLLGYLGILILGAVPALVYISLISGLVGGLVRSRHPTSVGVVMAFGYIVLQITTRHSVVGNILFPTGVMAGDTLSAWLTQQMSTPTYIRLFEPMPTIVPLPYLLFPILSGIFQIGLVWFIIGRIFEKEITKA